MAQQSHPRIGQLRYPDRRIRQLQRRIAKLELPNRLLYAFNNSGEPDFPRQLAWEKINEWNAEHIRVAYNSQIAIADTEANIATNVDTWRAKWANSKTIRHIHFDIEKYGQADGSAGLGDWSSTGDGNDAQRHNEWVFDELYDDFHRDETTIAHTLNSPRLTADNEKQGFINVAEHMDECAMQAYWTDDGMGAGDPTSKTGALAGLAVARGTFNLRTYIYVWDRFVGGTGTVPDADHQDMIGSCLDAGAYGVVIWSAEASTRDTEIANLIDIAGSELADHVSRE